jgi:hypothetical protein
LTLKKNIKMYKTIVLVCVCLCCFLSSCRTSRQEIQKNTTTATTLIEQRETYRDTTLFTPKAETSLTIPASELVFKPSLNDVLKPKTFTQKNGNATAKVEILPTGLTITATCDSIAMVAKIKQELQREISATARSNTENNNKKTGHSLFDVLLAFITGLLLGAAATFILKTLKIV